MIREISMGGIMEFFDQDIVKYYRLFGILFVIMAIWLLADSPKKDVKIDDKIIQLYSDEYNAIELENFSLLDSLDILSLAEGKQEMSKHKVVIAGISRDNVKDIPVMIKHIEYIGSFFADYRVIIFENDSIDGTKKILNEWKVFNSRVNIISTDYGNKKRPSHAFMAKVRNNYLEALDNKEYDEFDMLMVVDMDASYGIDVRAVQDSFSKIDYWSAVCSNGVKSKGQMYDSFAYRDKEFPWTAKEWQEICSSGDDQSNEWVKTCKGGEKYSKGYMVDNLSFRTGWQERDRLYWLLIMPQIQKFFPVNSNLVPVLSCFGGMAFYKREFIKDCRYESIDNDCEHVSFHKCLRDEHHGEMFLNPAQAMRYSQYGE